MRDFQRSKVYKSEWAVRFDHRRLSSIEECQAYVDELRTDRSYNHFGRMPRITVRPGHGSASADWDWIHGPMMTLPHWAQTEFTIIHELAHFSIPPESAHHGPEFAWVELQAIERKFGKHHAEELRGWFFYYGVKVGKTSKGQKQRKPKHWIPPGQTGTL